MQLSSFTNIYQSKKEFYLRSGLALLLALIFFAIDYSVYLNLINKCADVFLSNDKFSISNGEYSLNGEFLFRSYTSFLLKKWFVFIFILIVITPAKLKPSVKYLTILVLVNFLGLILKLFMVAKFMEFGYTDLEARKIGSTPILLAYTITVLNWVKLNRYTYLQINALSRFDEKSILKVLRATMITLVLTIITSNLILFLFPFNWWIHQLLLATQVLTDSMGYPATIDGKYFIGTYGTIYMEKYCLGFGTMLLFAMFIFFTGKSLTRRLIYILAGLIVLNLANIGRYTLLFVYIQKSNGYHLNIDVHTLLNIVIYTFVFILWVIWHEYFNDLGPRKTLKSKSK